MNKSKLQKYELYGSIHTIAIVTQNTIADELPEAIQKCIDIVSIRGNWITYKINVNQLSECKTFKEFKRNLIIILKACRITSYSIRRIDYRLDSYESEHYRDFAKLNKYLISAIATAYKVKNCYRTTELFTENQLSIAIKNSDIEVEHYNREKKSEVTGNCIENAKSRLELRIKAHNNFKNGWNLEDLPSIVEAWNRILVNALEYLTEVQARYNEALLQEYHDNKDFYVSLKHFLLQNRDRIFTTKQMLALLTKIGLQRPDNFCKNFKSRHSVEFYLKKDVKHVLEVIITDMIRFFNAN